VCWEEISAGCKIRCWNKSTLYSCPSPFPQEGVSKGQDLLISKAKAIFGARREIENWILLEENIDEDALHELNSTLQQDTSLVEEDELSSTEDKLGNLFS